MTDQTSQNKTASLEKMGIDRQGMKKGSRIVPLLLLAITVVIFVVYGVQPLLPELRLMSVESKSDLPTKGQNLFVIAMVKEKGKEGLHFRVFDAKGYEVTKGKASEEEIISNAEEGEPGKKVQEKLNNLKEQLEPLWGKEHFSLKEQDEIITEVVTLTNYNFSPVQLFAVTSQGFASKIANDFPLVLKAQIKTIGVLFLYSLVPGLFGLIYRRAFWKWFGIAFAVLYAIQWGFVASGAGSITPEVEKNLHQQWTELAFLYLEVLFILWLLVFRLRRHSAAAIDPATRRINIIWAVTLIMLAIGWVVVSGSSESESESVFKWWEYGGVSVLLVLGYAILRQSLVSAASQGTKSKNIVVCLDGTWNQPGTTDFGYLAETNVFKLFKMLKGTAPDEDYNASQCKQYLDDSGFVKQIAFYFHGVGNKMENSELGQLFGGAFGMGASAIVERAYLDIARVYSPGDRIFIFGFSRGAAIARLLAGVIGPRSVPTSLWTLHLFGRHWLVWKSSKNIGAAPAAEISELASTGNSGRKRQHEKDEAEVPVEVLGCWDTVGAFGISKNILGIPFQQVNLLKDLNVSLCVRRAYHMVALDEMRDSFVPTLMEPDPIEPERIVEVWFSGNHSNVGGGYATDRLSNITLDFLLRHVSSGYACDTGMEPGDESWGLYLSAMKKGQSVKDDGKDIALIDPDPRGQIRQSTGGLYKYAPRKLPIHAIIHDDVFNRMQEAVPVYAPQSLFNLNKELVEKRADIEKEVNRLEETHSLNKTEAVKIRTSKDKLSLTKWSQYLELELDDKYKIKEKLTPAKELSNAPIHLRAV